MWRLFPQKNKYVQEEAEFHFDPAGNIPNCYQTCFKNRYQSLNPLCLFHGKLETTH